MGASSTMTKSQARVAHIARHLQPALTGAVAQHEESAQGQPNDPGFSGSYAGDYKIRDLSLATRGRMELDMAEVEMPGLMNCRKEFGDLKPLAGGSRYGVSAHDGSNRGTHGDAARVWRRRALGDLQHLLHAGRGGRCHRGSEDCICVRVEGP